MKIGIFTDQYLPNMSGMVTSIINQRKGLEALGHDVYIIAPAARGYKNDDPKIIRVFSVDPRVFLGNTMAIPTKGILSRLVRMQFDVVHVQEMFTIGALGHAVAKKSGVPLVASIHTQWDKLFRHYPTTVIAAAFGIGIGYPLYFGLRNTMSTYLQTGSERNPLSQQFGRNLLLFANECDAVIAPSLHVMDKLKRFHCKTPLYHIPNGIERIDIKMTVQLPSNSRQAVKFVCVGRVSKEKRTAKLIEAFIGLKQIDAELFIIGDGPDLSTCVELVENRNASNRVHFLGSLPNDQTRQLIADSDILVLASHGFDNQPMVILEALMAGKGVLYCDEQLRDGLDRSNSLLVPHSIAGLREGLRILSSNPELVAKLAKGSQKLAKEYDYIRIAKRVEEVYKKLLS